MTLIENDSPKVQYTGPFIKGQLLPLTFPYIATEDVKMIIDDTPAIFNVDYEIITEPNNEHPVAYPNSAYIKSDLPDAKQITIYRSTPLDQQAPFPQQSKFRSERIEQALDKLTMQQQEQVEQLSRCIIAPITLETFNGQLPEPAADQALKWNAEGTELENYDIIGEQEAFETEVNTKFEEQSIAIEDRIGQFEEETNTQFSDFRNEINENLEAVLNAAGKLDTLEQQVQAATDAATAATNAANAAITSATKADEYAEEASISVTKADEYAEEASISATKAEDALEEIKQVIQNAEIDIGTVTDALNNKVDLDGGNYPGSGLEAIIGKNEGGSGLQLFDTILKDHVLTYEESKGLALQGTYVYKEALAGSRYGYPDFYNKCLEEYENDSNTQQYLKSNITKVGALTDNQGVLSGFTPSVYAKVDKAINFNSADSWEINLKLKTGSNYTAFNDFFGVVDWGMALGISTARKFSLAIGTGGSNWSIGSPVGTHTVQDNTDYYIRVKFTGSAYTLEYSLNGIDYSTDIIIQSSVKTISGIPNLGLYSNGSNLTGSIDLNESYININGERAWIGTETIVQHPNGHRFYDISLKDQIDEIFNSTGMAWFYGVDTENERIFLPRDKYFAVKGNVAVAGNGIALGMTDGTSNAGASMSTSGTYKHLEYYNSTFGLPVGTDIGDLSGTYLKLQNTIGVTTDPMNSGIEGKLTSNTDKYLYICVGNTTNYEGVTDVVNQGMEILEQVNQGIESRVKLDGSNAEFPYITQTYVNGTSGYIIYSNGYGEQWGYITPGANPHTVTLLKEYANTDYNIMLGDVGTNAGAYSNTVNNNNKTASSFQVYLANTTTWESYWRAYGYLA